VSLHVLAQLVNRFDKRYQQLVMPVYYASFANIQSIHKSWNQIASRERPREWARKQTGLKISQT
jgi:hypothetical protein